MRLNTMLAAADGLSDLTLRGITNDNKYINTGFEVDVSSPAEHYILQSVAQELDHWEKLVFSFDMDREPGGPSQSDSGANTRGRTKRTEQSRQSGVPSLSSGPTPSSSNINIGASHLEQPIDPRLLHESSFPSQPPNVVTQMQNPLLAQLTQIAGLDPYTLHTLAALSALQNGQNAPRTQASNPVPDLSAIVRQAQSLLYPNTTGGNGGSTPGVNRAFTEHQPSSSAQRSDGGQSSLTDSSNQQWSSQLQGLGSFQFPSSLDPSLAAQLSQLSPLIMSNSYFQPTETPGAGPSSGGSRARSRSTASTSGPSTPVSASISRNASLMDESGIAEDKRRRNTAASARFRIKKKHKTLALERSVVELEARAEDLEREASELRRENGWLKEMLIMKGRSVRARAVPSATPVSNEVDEESSGEEEEEEENRDDAGEPVDDSSRKGKGKEKAS